MAEMAARPPDVGGDLRCLVDNAVHVSERVITIATMPPRPSHSAARQRLRATITVATSSAVVSTTNRPHGTLSQPRDRLLGALERGLLWVGEVGRSRRRRAARSRPGDRGRSLPRVRRFARWGHHWRRDLPDIVGRRTARSPGAGAGRRSMSGNRLTVTSPSTAETAPLRPSPWRRSIARLCARSTIWVMISCTSGLSRARVTPRSTAVCDAGHDR